MTEHSTTITFLSNLQQLGVKLRVEEGKLVIDAPKGAIDHSLREQLALQKNEILSFLSSSTRPVLPDIIPIEGDLRKGKLPLSYSQSRQWYLEQLESGTSAYNIPFIRHLKGQLDISILERCFNEIIARHESLRTRFDSANGEPYQEVLQEQTIRINLIDLTDFSIADREVNGLQAADREIKKGFDLSKGQLIRVSMIKLDEDEYFFTFVMHHIVSDGWSMRVLLNEISMIYGAFVNDFPSPLSELAIQYPDYACWQREYLKGEVVEDQLSYWEDQLSDCPPLIDLHTDFPRPYTQTYNGAYKQFRISGQTTTALKSISKGEGSLFMVLLSALKVLLYRHTRQEDINIGTYIANRNHKELENLIGFFVNTLVLRTDLSGDPPFNEIYNRVRKTAIDAYAHQDLPFEILLDTLKVERTMSHSPLFQVMFVFQNITSHHLDLPGIQVSSVDLTSNRAEFDLTLWMWEQNGSLLGSLNYNTDLFKATTIDRIVRQFCLLIENIVKDSQQPISRIPLITNEDEERIGKEWSCYPTVDTPVLETTDRCIHHMFEFCAKKDPYTIALICNDIPITYGDLNEKSNQLAHYLRQVGIRTESRVGICIERSSKMIIGILGILKSGGAYLPMDPQYPKDRLAYMLKDSDVDVVLTEEKFAKHFTDTGSEIVCLDTVSQNIALQSRDNLSLGVAPNHLAYIIYTSGSTGKPKGVMVEHRSLVNFAASAKHEYQLKKGDQVLQFASITFDASAEEIYPTLASSATLVLRNEDMISSMPTFVETISDWKISVLDLPTAFFHEFVIGMAQDGLNLPDSLRLIIIGGERAQSEFIKLWQAHGKPSVRLLNTYGPTETTVVATSCDLTNLLSDGFDGVEIPIGKPLGNASVFILDSNRQLVPIGMPGELYIGGIGLARGYMNLPEMTAAAFIDHRFPDGTEARLYKTGDLVRFLDDGNLEYLGRIDSQIKIRGYRIETDEIESVVKNFPGIQNAVVSTYTDSSGHIGICAYFTAADGSVHLENGLRDFLKIRLPDYMIPAAFVKLDALPLTSHGKINFKGLPYPETNTSAADNAYVDPTTPMEFLIAAIWQDVLGVERVGIHDKFFDLGGNSLLSMRVIARIKKETGFDIHPREFIFQSLGQIAAICDGKSLADITPPQKPIESREAFFFGETAKQLFGCLHHPTSSERRDCALVLCYPMGQEYIRSHRTFVQLASRLSSAGFPVLRFDYFGCGDSAGDFEYASIAQWVEDISTAVHEIRKRCNPKNVCLLGLRLGGTLSMLAGSNGLDVDGMILWNPVLNGKKFIREQYVLHKETLKNTYASRGRKYKKGPKEFIGYPFSDDLLTDIGNIDLYQVNRKSHNMALFIKSGEMEDEDMMKSLSSETNPLADVKCLPGPNVWLEDPYQEIVQHSVIQTAVSWLREVYR